MRRIIAVGSALAFGLGLAVLGAAGASAQGDGRARFCSDCGPAGTTRYVRTIHPSLYVTRYRDRSVVDRVTRVRHIVDVTRIQPIIHVHDVTRVHHLTLVSVRDAYAVPGQSWAPVTYRQPAYLPGYSQPGYLQPGFLQPGYLQAGYLQPGAGIAAGCSCGDE